MDTLNLAEVCDSILEDLNSKLSSSHPYLYTAFFTDKFDYGSATKALLQLVEDKYVTEGSDKNTNPNSPSNRSYTITPLGQYFIENFGYRQKFKNDLLKEKYALEIPKSTLDTNKNSKLLYRITVIIAMISLFTNIATYLKKDGKDELYKQLIQIQKQIEEIKQSQLHQQIPIAAPKDVMKKDSSKKK